LRSDREDCTSRVPVEQEEEERKGGEERRGIMIGIYLKYKI